MENELVQKANDIRRGERENPEAAFRIAKELAKCQYFDAARRLAEHLVETDNIADGDHVGLHQKLALWTSKNPDAPDDTKHDRALEILDSIKETETGESLATTSDCESLGIAGGICKRKWMVTGNQADLERSLHYYERGSAQGFAVDNGYTAINAAFVIDLLADVNSLAGIARKAEARSIRERVRDTLLDLKDEPAWEGGPPRQKLRWFNETIAEACFGLEDYENATHFLKKAYEDETVEPWEFETAARQFAWLARLQAPGLTTRDDFEQSPAWNVLREIYGGHVGAGSLFAGKFGLALSGGGFRASLFHIGVLASLAERDLLRHVEVLSCVSGGSILGAYYYLELRKLLQDKADEEITREHYIELVERVAGDFLAGVQENIRTRIGGNLFDNLRMIFVPGYSTTTRLAELYEQHLYDRIDDDKQRVLRKLFVRPKGQESFKPKYDNWRRANKVPILILNATSMNTGHNWQFTASWMGEPPAFIDSEIDGNYRLRRMYLESEAPKPHRNIRIGSAVAASSCVPGLFSPLELHNLYEDGVTVRLVDGGVHDNQGVFGLLDQNCNVMMVSDASGQMTAVDDPPDDPMGVLLRTISMLQARVRAAEYREIESRRRTGRLKSLLFLHLKQDLEVEDRDWINCANPKQLSGEDLRKQKSVLTGYGILKKLQRLIAGIRTDLDSFNETEARALMTSGYNMTGKKAESSIKGVPINEQAHEWKFLDIAGSLRDGSDTRLERLLKVASSGFFKVWELSAGLRLFKFIIGALIGFALLFALVFWRDQPLNSLSGIIAALALLALGILLGKFGLAWILKALNLRKTAHQILVGIGLSIVGWAGTWIHLSIFDRLYLNKGKFTK
ncbi:MAG: patatin-like phospholipase family protein [Gammaproteobacteria bacterium]|nr:patatin-like phospholipase family protein [Gammaproteobacteria bacterium]